MMKTESKISTLSIPQGGTLKTMAGDTIALRGKSVVFLVIGGNVINETLNNKITKWLTKNYTLRYNTILNSPEWQQEDGSWEKIDILMYNSLLLNCQNELGEKGVTFDKIRAILNSDRVEKCDPLKEYYDSLPEWQEGDPDYIGELCARVHSTAGAELFCKYFTRWLVGMVAQHLGRRNSTNNYILILMGEQGKGKSTFFRELTPKELRRYFCVKSNGAFTDKDDRLRLAENALVCMEEI